jgi:hypothetical protein
MRKLIVPIVATIITASGVSVAVAQDNDAQRGAQSADRNDDRGEWGWLGLLGLAGLMGLKRRDRDEHVTGRTTTTAR